MTVSLQRLYRELQTSESYLAEAQQLTHTGSFGRNVSTGEIYWTAETFRILEFEPMAKVTIESILHIVLLPFVKKGLELGQKALETN